MSDNKKEKRNGSAHEPPTVIYTTAGCVNSACVIQLFQSQHIPFKQIDTTKNEEAINELLTKHGKSYVPLVFHLGEYVGDAEAILLLHRQGQLLKKLKIDENTKSNGEKSSEVENLPIDALKQKFMQLDQLYKAMKDPANGVPIKNRFVNYKTFKGRTLIKWLAAHLKTSDDEAMKKAYEFFAGGYFHAIKTGTNFKNDNSLYRFKEDDDKKVLNAWRVDVSEEQKPVELATKMRQLMYKILSKNITADFKNIDYAEINTSKEFWFYLQSALSLQSLDLTTLREMDRVTFFLDILYCIIMHVNIAFGLPTNTNIVSFWDYYGDYSYNIDGTSYTVSDIINVQLRGKRPLREKDKDKNKDYELGEISEKRIHFAIMSYFPMRTWSPPIMFYSPETLTLGLQCAARVFCERQIGMDVKAQTVALPRMFERYKEDFGATDLEVLEYISEFISGERQQQFKFLLQGRSSLIRIKYHDDPNVFNVEDNILEGENVDQEEVAKVMSRRIQKHQSEAEGSSSLSLDRLHSERLSNELFGLVHLTELDLSRNKLDKLPTEFAQLNKLRFLNMNSNRLRTLENFPTLNLEVLELADNLLQTIPAVFCQSMTTLRSLSLESNQLQKLPKEFSHLQKLEELYLQSNQFTRIPSTLGKLPNLAVLELSLNKVKDLDRLETLTRLEELYLHDQTQFVLDEAGAAKFANLPYLEVLDLSKNGLYELPRAMFAGLTSLEELYLQNNKITEVPPEICLLQNVIELDVKANPLRTPPLFICEMGIDEIISFYDRGNDNDGVGSESESISKMAKEEKKKRGGSFIKKLDFAGIFTKDKDKEGSEGKSPRGSRRSINFSGNNNVSSNNDKLPERSESPSKKKITVSQTKPRSNTLDGSGPPSALSLSTGALFGKGQTIDSVIGEDDEVSPLTERDDVTRRGSMTASPSRSPRKLSDLLRKSKKKTVTSDFKKIEDVKSHTQPLLAVSGLREKTMIVPVPGYYIEDPRGPMPKSYKLQEFLHLYDYQRYFYNTEHVNFVGVDQTIGPLVICISREPVEPSIDDPLRGVIPRKVCNYKTVPRREVRRNIAGNFSARVRSVAAIEAEKSIEDQTDKAKLFPSKFIYRALVRTKKGDFRVSIPLTMLKETKRRYIRPQSLLKALQECFNQDESLFSWSVNFREAPPEKLPHDKLRDMEQKLKMNGYKFGVIYAKEGQFTDDDMFQNATGSPVFDEFLSMIGETIDLKGWQNYNAGLDVKGNTTGKHSVFTKFRDYEIMLHVSTLLPFNDEDTQQLERKRHIGNDIVVIIFIDGKSTFNPALIKSVFNHVFVVVSPVTNNNSNSKEQSYKVEIVSKEGVLASEPVLPNPPIFTRGPQFREYLLTKLINAERAAYLAKNFLGPIEWTRGNLLTELLEKEKS